jgi:hypothetical protein
VAQREELNRKLKKRSLAQTKLLRQGVQFYESALPALHRGDVTPEELYASTGWTEEHYENFKRRLIADQQRADIQRKMFLDQQVHKDGEVIEQLKGSLRYCNLPLLVLFASYMNTLSMQTRAHSDCGGDYFMFFTVRRCSTWTGC